MFDALVSLLPLMIGSAVVPMPITAYRQWVKDPDPDAPPPK